MQIMVSYADLLTESEVLKDQIAFTKKELEYWFGVNIDTDKGVPLDSTGSFKFGTETALIQSDKRLKTYHKLTKRLQEVEYAIVRMDMMIEKFDGLDYKIAYKRIVEVKTHQEIANDLGYSHDYIRTRWSRIKPHKQHTESLLKS